jgi:osmotically-inducible protein OsmY
MGLAGPTLSGLGGTTPGGSTPLALGGTGTGGRTGTSGAAASPSPSDPYSAYSTNPLAVGWGPSRQLAPVATGTTTGGTGGTGGAGGFGGAGGGGGGTGTTTGFSSALNSTGQIQTLKANSLAQPLYAATTTTTTGAASSATATTTGFTTAGTRRAPPYITTVGFRRGPRIAPAEMQADIRQALDRSPRLSNGRAIQLAINGTTVVLQGAVASARERRVAELLARMTPGVRDVRNELRIPATPPPEGE